MMICWRSPAPAPFLTFSLSRNWEPAEVRSTTASLAPIFKDIKLIEAWGSGIQKVRTDLKDYPEIDLVLIEAGHTFQVQFVKKGGAEAESGPSQKGVAARVQPESGQSEGRVTARVNARKNSGSSCLRSFVQSRNI